MPRDPRLLTFRRVPTVNVALQDKAIRHAIFIERFKGHQVNKIVGFLNKEVFPDLLSQLSTRLERISVRGFDTSVTSTRRLTSMMENLDDLIDDGFRDARTILTSDLNELASVEVRLQKQAISKALPVDISLNSPNVTQLNAIVNKRPFQGAILKEWYGDLGLQTKKSMRRQINIGLVEGESVPNIVRRLQGTRAAGYKDGILNTARHQTEAVVRTAVNHTVTQAREDTYKANDDVIKGIQIVATLDSRTTPICMGLDGTVFAPNEGKRPPFHWNCRTTTTPILKSWHELGINLKEAPPGTRASMGGQVPATQTYGQWLKNQDPDTQADALGKKKAELFRRGNVDIKKFADKRGNVLNIKQLEALEAR